MILKNCEKNLSVIENARKDILESYGSENKVVKQLIDLALLANNMLRGEDLSVFVKRSVDLIIGTAYRSSFAISVLLYNLLQPL